MTERGTCCFYTANSIFFIALTSAITAGGGAIGVGILTAAKYGLLNGAPIVSASVVAKTSAIGSMILCCPFSVGLADCIEASDSETVRSIDTVIKMSLQANMCLAPFFAVLGAKTLGIPVGYITLATAIGTPLLVIGMTAIGAKILGLSLSNVAYTIMMDSIVLPASTIGSGLKDCCVVCCEQLRFSSSEKPSTQSVAMPSSLFHSSGSLSQHNSSPSVSPGMN